MTQMKKIAFLASGKGTNAENLIKEIQAGRIPGAEAEVVICDRPGAGVIERAGKLGVELKVIDRSKCKSKSEFEAAIKHELDDRKIDFVALAGFMRILSCDFVRHFAGRIVNIHPSLLPAFPGAHAIRDAFEAKVTETGVTVHFVDEGVDTGPVILQKKVKVDLKDTLELLETKIHAVEYEVYPEALRSVISGKVRMPLHHRDDEFWTND